DGARGAGAPRRLQPVGRFRRAQCTGGALMLYSLLLPLHESFSLFNVFRYITFRPALATLPALLISLALGPWFIQRLRDFQIGQQISPEGHLSHQRKKGTPTMGGLL